MFGPRWNHLRTVYHRKRFFSLCRIMLNNFLNNINCRFDFIPYKQKTTCKLCFLQIEMASELLKWYTTLLLVAVVYCKQCRKVNRNFHKRNPEIQPIKSFKLIERIQCDGERGRQKISGLLKWWKTVITRDTTLISKNNAIILSREIKSLENSMNSMFSKKTFLTAKKYRVNFLGNFKSYFSSQIYILVYNLIQHV